MSDRASRKLEILNLYGQLPGGQTEKESRLYGFIPGEWLPDWVKQGYNQSIEGMAREVSRGKKVFDVDRDYNPNMLEDIASTVISFATPVDFATLAIGGGLGGAAVRKLAVNQLVKSGAGKELAVRAVNIGSKRILNQARAKSLTGGTALGFYSGLQSSLGQKVTTDDVDIVRTLKDSVSGGALGALTGGVGAKVQQAAARKGLTKYQSFGAEKTVETGVFGTASPLLEGELPSAESYIHAAGVIGGLTLKRAIVKKTIEVPSRITNRAKSEEQLRVAAEQEAKTSARNRVAQETWQDNAGQKTVRILTDWTGKERKQPMFKVEDVSNNKTFNIPKKDFFKNYTRETDKFGVNIPTAMRKRSFGLKKELDLSDLDYKQAIDKAAFGKDSTKSFDLIEKKSGFRSNYQKLSRAGKYRLLEDLRRRKTTNDILKRYKKDAIEVPEVSAKSLVQKVLPTPIYEAFLGVKKEIIPTKYRLTHPIAVTGRRLIENMNSRNATLFSRLATELNNAPFTTPDGKQFNLNQVTGSFLKAGRNKKIREQLGRDLESTDAGAVKRTENIRKVLYKTWGISEKSGLDLAPFVQNYFPRVMKPKIMKALYTDIDKIATLDPRTLSSDLIRKPGFEQNLRDFMREGFSPETVKILESMRQSIIQERSRASRGQSINVGFSQAFERLRNNVISERVILNKNLERKRKEKELPKEVRDQIYEKDAGLVLMNYIAQATKRVAYAENAGKDGRVMFDKIKSLQALKLGEQADILQRAFDTYTGLIELNPRYNYNLKAKNVLNDLVNFQVATKIGLGFATIPNVTQTFISTALKLGYSPFFKGTYYAITNKKYRDAIKKNSGAGTLELHEMIAGFQPQNQSKLGLMADKLTAVTQFQRINRINKLVSAYTSLEAVKTWQKSAQIKPKTLRQARRRDFAIRNLRELGITDFKQKITPKNVAKAMYEFSSSTQLQKNVFLEPNFFNNPKFQPFILFKRFGYRQAEMLSRWVNQAIKDKDLTFFLRLGAAGLFGGAFVNWSKATYSNALSGEDIYDDNYRLNADGQGEYTLKDFREAIGAVGAFGIVSDIVSSESPWRSVEFLAKPAIIQDSFKMYSAMQRIGNDMIELGPNSVTLRRSAKYLAPIFGTQVSRAARRLETPKQRGDRRRSFLSVTKKKIFDFMLADQDDSAKRVINEWNNAFPERPLTMGDIGPEEINRYLMRKYNRLEEETKDPLMDF